MDDSVMKSLPSNIANEKNRKEKLYNAIIAFLNENQLGWREPDKYGKSFVGDLCSLLWFIDGHHEVFSSRSCPIPSFFSGFVGYNRPELSKHRKRSISNLSRNRLLEHATSLQDHATNSWIQQPEWATFLTALVKLIESLSSYASYLAIRSNAMKQHHASPEPAVTFSDAVSVRYLPKTVATISPLLSALDSKISESEMYELVYVNDFAPKGNDTSILEN